MSFISLSYLLFFPIISLIYFLLPHKFRWILLLGGSYFFYMCWNIKYALLMLLSTIITYGSGILIKKIVSNDFKLETKKINQYKKTVLFISLFSNLGILFFFKYFNFINTSIAQVFNQLHLSWGFNNLNILLPVGISFYTFQALSYSLDVYYGKTEPTTHFGKYALFVSFFPQLVAGPIERSWHLLPQFDNKVVFDYNRVRSGLGLILWGVFKKVVIANRLAVVVNEVYAKPDEYFGFEIIVATIFFAFQIYCDFSAYTDIARGSAKVLGFDIMENFKRPYFAASIPEFWRRWHISLTTWFRDYVYIPLGGNRVTTPKWYANIMIVFLVSGLWHGAAWNFIIWGFLHGIFQLLDIHSRSIRTRINGFLKINIKSTDIQVFKILWTFSLVCFAWIFFRAETFSKAKILIEHAVLFNPWTFFDGSMYNLGLDSKDFTLSLLLIFGLLGVWALEKKTVVSQAIYKQHIVSRYLIYTSLILSIIILGFYGNQYDASEFIYFQF